MRHEIECLAPGQNECDTCLAAGEHTPANLCRQVWDEGNGYQSWHYCQECFDNLEEATPD